MAFFLIKILLFIWTLTLWWLIGSVVLYLSRQLPDWDQQRQQAVLFWPVTLLSPNSFRNNRPSSKE